MWPTSVSVTVIVTLAYVEAIKLFAVGEVILTVRAFAAGTTGVTWDTTNEDIWSFQDVEEKMSHFCQYVGPAVHAFDADPHRFCGGKQALSGKDVVYGLEPLSDAFLLVGPVELCVKSVVTFKFPYPFCFRHLPSVSCRRS